MSVTSGTARVESSIVAAQPGHMAAGHDHVLAEQDEYEYVLVQRVEA